MSDNKQSGRENAWARPVNRLKLGDAPAGAMNINVDGRQLTGPIKGFGQMWQKTYKIRLEGADVTPQEVISAWKEKFPTFWPKGNHFYPSLAGIAPGEVALLNLSTMGMPLSTGVMVIYADDESFTFMTPEGHMLSAWITFSAYEEDGATIAQAQALLRATDPLSELGLRLGFAHKMEDDMWNYTLTALADHFGVAGQVEQRMVCVDPRIQWSEAKNIWRSAAIRSALYTPLWLARKLFGR